MAARALATLFRQQIGQTVHRYLTQVRMHHGAALIRQGEKIEAVSLLVGFRSKKNCYQHFNQQIGVTPVVYKKARMGLAPLFDREPAAEREPKSCSETSRCSGQSRTEIKTASESCQRRFQGVTPNSACISPSK